MVKNNTLSVKPNKTGILFFVFHKGKIFRGLRARNWAAFKKNIKMPVGSTLKLLRIRAKP